MNVQLKRTIQACTIYLVSLTLVPRPDISAAGQGPSTGDFDSATARAWTTAGAGTRWPAPDRNENWVYTAAKPANAVALPAFRFSVLRPHFIEKLPKPAIPFGIVLDGADMTDESITGIEQFSSLHALYLSRTPDAALSRLRDAINLRILYLGSTKVTDAGVKQLAALEQLHTLRLSGTAVTDAGLKELAGLRNLQWLNLEYTAVTDAGLTELVKLKALRILHLGNTKLSDAGLPQLLLCRACRWYASPARW